MNNSEIKNKAYYWNGYLIILILAIFLLLALYQLFSELKVNVFLIIYIQLIGLVFLLSYFFENNNFIFKFAIKVCEKNSTIKSRKNAFFCFGIATFFSIRFFLLQN